MPAVVKEVAAVDRDVTPESSQAEPARIPRRAFLVKSAGVAASLTGASALLAACGGSSPEGEVVVLSWQAYLTDPIKQRFKDATGITLRGVPADTDADMFTKLKAGGGGQYDIVFADAGWSPTYYSNDLIQPLELTEFPASDQLAPVFREDTSLPYVLSANQALLYPNMWTSLSLTWNTTVDFQPSKPYSWNALWDPALDSSKIEMMGSGEDFLAITGLALGIPREDVYKLSGDQLAEVEARLQELTPFQITSVEQQFRNDIRTQKAWIGLATGLGFGALINQEAGEEIAQSVVPKEGSLGWVDGPQLVKDAKNGDNARKFIEFFGSDPELQDYLWKEYNYPQCNMKSVERVLDQGGEGAKSLVDQGGDQPELAKKILYQAPPEDPAAWAAAWDRASAA
jgi:spermidine/putrescine transport system substrate-binding protein